MESTATQGRDPERCSAIEIDAKQGCLLKLALLHVLLQQMFALLALEHLCQNGEFEIENASEHAMKAAP
jgi:hypothetical protein